MTVSFASAFVSAAAALARRRRVLALGAVTVLLHVATLDWMATRLGDRPAHAPAPVPAVISAQWRPALPARAPAAAPLADIKPLERPPARPPVPRVAPRTVALPEPDAAPSAAAPHEAGVGVDAWVDTMAEAAPDVAARAAPAQAGAPPAAGAVQSAPALAAADGSPAARRYNVQLPPSADFELELKRVDKDGANWSGVGTMSWRTDGSTYRVTMEAGISMLVTRVNLLVLGSEGTIDDAGIAPVKATEKRRGRSMTATHFNRADGTISFSGNAGTFPLLAGAQDKATVPFQLGAIGRGDVNQFGSDIDIQVGEDKDANMFRFHLVGEEELDTKLGKLVTWHLTRPPKPGSYSSRLDIWLAPSLHWYPVQIRNTEANGALTTQTVSKMTMATP